MKKLLKILFLLAAFLLLPFSAFAAPAITGTSGTFTDGQTVTISGSGFGSSGPNVVLFDDFEGGTNGASIPLNSPKIGSWIAKGTSDYYTNTAHVSGNLAMQSDQSIDYGNPLITAVPNPTTNIFVSWWIYLPAGDNYPGEGSGSINWKTMWLMGSNTVDNDLDIPTLLGVDNWCVNGNSSPYTAWPAIHFTKGQWKRLSAWVKGNTGDNSDGHYYMWELTNTGVVQLEHDDAARIFHMYNINGSPGHYEQVSVNAYGRQTANSHPTFDDVYIATGPNAQARVEIGNASTYANCTKLGVVTTASWQNGAITGTVRPGSVQTGTAYLYVFDADGNVNSSGYAVTLGGSSGGDTTPPASPTGLSVS